MCEICGKTLVRLVIDHNHKTGKLRGVLCVSCNAALGGFMDDSELLRTAAAYLEDKACP